MTGAITTPGRPPTASLTSQRAELGAHLRLLAGASPVGKLIELRFRPRQAPMSRLFLPAVQLDRVARTIVSLTPNADVYIGVLLRTRRAGGRGAVAASHLCWVEIDRPDALTRLQRFAHQPALVLSSGTPGHAHAYWELQRPVDVAELETANRRLAHHLGGDLASVDAARILRPLSVGRADGADVLPARSFADASVTGRGVPR